MGLIWKKDKNVIVTISQALFEISDVIKPEDEFFLEQVLVENAKELQAPPYQETPFSIIKRDSQGRIVAGLTGKTFWNWLYVDNLWVDKTCRGQGLGRSMMAAAEQEGVKRGCTDSFLWTESFEGPDFYPRLGYERFVALDDFPIGHQRLGFMKRLAT